jgi:pyrroloquinoline quinone biosynthesis protein B
MRVRVLGSGAGGGFPQWNCGCSNCRRYRSGSLRGSARSQAQIAVSTNDEHWYLLNASPDLRYQIESIPELHPRSSGRNSPVRGIILSGADLDLCLGLLLLREWQALDVYSTAGVRAATVCGNRFFRVLERMPDQVRWHAVEQGTTTSLGSFSFTLVPLPGQYPGWVTESPDLPAHQAVSCILAEGLAYVPGLACVTPELMDVFAKCKVLLVDGTFWSEDELIQIEPNARRASEIGHMPMSGPNGSVKALSSLSGVRRIYIHINNTNPVLDESSPEYRTVRDAGWEIAYDGMELEL